MFSQQEFNAKLAYIAQHYVTDNVGGEISAQDVRDALSAFFDVIKNGEGGITTSQLADAIITAPKIANGTITYNKIASSEFMTNAEVDALFQ